MVGLSDEALSSIIGDIYDCAVEPERWQDTIVRLNALLGSAYAGVSLHAPTGYAPVFGVLSPWDMDLLAQGAAQIPFTELPGMIEVMEGDVDTPVSNVSHLGEAAFSETRYYREWAEPHGFREGLAMKFVHTPDRIGVFALNSLKSRPLLDENDLRFIRALAPHLRRAAMISDLLQQARVAAEAYSEILRELATPVLLTDTDGRILFANGAAEAMLAASKPIFSKGGVLQTDRPDINRSLSDAIARAGVADQVLGRRGIGLPLSGPGEAPAVAYVLPLTAGTARSAFRPAMAAVFVSTTTSATPLPEAVLITLFDLTPAEARVLLQFVAGRGTATTAGALGVSENTLKTHLKRIYAKTGTSRQAELVALVGDIVAPLSVAASNPSQESTLKVSANN